MTRVTEITKESRTIFIVDHSDCKESEMIDNVNELKDRILKKGCRVMLVSIYNDRSYATPNYMRVAEQATAEAIHLLEKHVVVGLNEVKKMILKGYNQKFGKNVRNFTNVDEALGFLLETPVR